MSACVYRSAQVQVDEKPAIRKTVPASCRVAISVGLLKARRQFSAKAIRWHNAGIIETAAKGQAYMEHDEEKIDEMVLALLHLTTFTDGPSMRTWKGQDWAMERLYKAGYIGDPKNKAKSVTMTEEGLEKSRELFERYFVRKA